MTDERFEVQRTIKAAPDEIFRVLRDPRGHVAIDSAGMLMSATGEPVSGVGDSFVVHMDREALNDYPLGEYDVTVNIITYEQDREIAWPIGGLMTPSIVHAISRGAEKVLTPTVMAPILPIAKTATSHSGRFGRRTATRSPFRTPTARRARARSSARAWSAA